MSIRHAVFSLIVVQAVVAVGLALASALFIKIPTLSLQLFASVLN